MRDRTTETQVQIVEGQREIKIQQERNIMVKKQKNLHTWLNKEEREKLEYNDQPDRQLGTFKKRHDYYCFQCQSKTLKDKETRLEKEVE